MFFEHFELFSLHQSTDSRSENLKIVQSKTYTVRFKNFRVENFRDLLKTFEVFEIHVFDPGLKTFEVFVKNSRFKNFRVGCQGFWGPKKVGSFYSYMVEFWS